jgi:hypothetical protein
MSKLVAGLWVTPPREMRYRTVGDWKNKDCTTVVEVADTGNDDYNFLLLIHELVEAYLCRKAGVTTEEVDTFDINMAQMGDYEPGENPQAPYYKQHQFANIIELLVARELGVNWQRYEECLNNLELPDATTTL